MAASRLPMPVEWVQFPYPQSHTGESPVNKSFKENTMKNIETILAEAGVELTEEQKTAINKSVGENYKPVSDWQKQVDKVTNLTEQLNSTKEALKKFDGVDAEELNRQISDLKSDLEAKEKEYQTQLADRDFQDLLKESISEAKGKNAKAITALLEVEDLKASKNQKEDIQKALKALAEAEDSKMLFGESEPEIIGKGDPIGTVNKSGNQDGDAQMRAVMGLPPLKSE